MTANTSNNATKLGYIQYITNTLLNSRNIINYNSKNYKKYYSNQNIEHRSSKLSSDGERASDHLASSNNLQSKYSYLEKATTNNKYKLLHNINEKNNKKASTVTIDMWDNNKAKYI